MRTTVWDDDRRDRVVILGGGPGGYEAALVARPARGRGHRRRPRRAGRLRGAHRLRAEQDADRHRRGDDARRRERRARRPARAAATRRRRRRRGRASTSPRSTPGSSALALAQSHDIRTRLERRGRPAGRAAPAAWRSSRASSSVGGERLEADAVLVATGARPRVVPGAEPDGERILTWTQVYDLAELPERLIVVGSGVTGAEFASRLPRARLRGRARLLPRPGAARRGRRRRRGARGRAAAPRHDGAWAARAPRVGAADGDGVVVTLADGRTVEGSHCLMAVGSVAEHHAGSAWRRPASGSTTAASSRSTGSRAPRRAGSTRPATAPAC